MKDGKDDRASIVGWRSQHSRGRTVA